MVIFLLNEDPIFFSENNTAEGHFFLHQQYGDNEPASTGTHVIAIIDIRVEQAGSIMINFSGTGFRDQNNIEIQISESVPGLMI